MYCIYVFAKILWLQGVPVSPCHETAKIVDARVTEYFIIIIIIFLDQVYWNLMMYDNWLFISIVTIL